MQAEGNISVLKEILINIPKRQSLSVSVSYTHLIVRPKLADYESNIEKAGKGDSMAQEWQKTVAGYVNASDYVYASVVDTAYPDVYKRQVISSTVL